MSSHMTSHMISHMISHMTSHMVSHMTVCDSPGLGRHYNEFRSFPVYEMLEHTQVSLLHEKMKEQIHCRSFFILFLTFSSLSRGKGHTLLFSRWFSFRKSATSPFSSRKQQNAGTLLHQTRKTKKSITTTQYSVPLSVALSLSTHNGLISFAALHNIHHLQYETLCEGLGLQDILLLVWDVCTGHDPCVRSLLSILLVYRVIFSLDRERGHAQPLSELVHTALLKRKKKSNMKKKRLGSTVQPRPQAFPTSSF